MTSEQNIPESVGEDTKPTSPRVDQLQAPPTLRTCKSDPYIGRDLRDARALIQSSKAMWEQRIDNHKTDRLINPFSEFWGQNQGQYRDTLVNSGAVWKDNDKRTKLEKVDDKYGLPVDGSLTAIRGAKAKNNIATYIVECCENITQLGTKQSDGSVVVKFGVLFKAYERINDYLVGLLVRARKHGLVEFPGEMLYQRQDENVDIVLKKMPTLEELELKFIAFNQKQQEDREERQRKKLLQKQQEMAAAETNGEHCIQ